MLKPNADCQQYVDLRTDLTNEAVNSYQPVTIQDAKNYHCDDEYRWDERSIQAAVHRANGNALGEILANAFETELDENGMDTTNSEAYAEDFRRALNNRR